MRHIRTAFIGFGYRGKQLMRLMRAIDFFDIVGIADKNVCLKKDSLSTPFYQGEEAFKTIYVYSSTRLLTACRRHAKLE